MIRALIFDLDNCLAASDAMGREFMHPVFRAIRDNNRGTLPEDQLTRAFAEMWRVPLDAVAEKYHFSEAMRDAGWKASVGLQVRTPMEGYEDLRVIAKLPVPRFLVTSGFRKLQESKIRALDIAKLFTAVEVDAIDEPNRKGKQGIFAEIAAKCGVRPEEIMVVGDNPDSEIKAGNALGMPTVQILRPGVPRGTTATYVIEGLEELPALLNCEVSSQ